MSALQNNDVRLCSILSSLSIFLVLTLIATASFADEPVSVIEMTSSDKAAMESGEVIVNVRQGDINRGVVTGILQAPVSEVIPLVERCWEYGDWRESVTDTGLERRESDEVVICRGTAIVPFPARNRHGHFRVHNHTMDVAGVESFVSEFQYIEDSGNVEDMYGYWLLQPYGENGEHTILRHILNIDIGSWIPGALIRWATGRSLPDTILGIRELLNDKNGQNLSGPQFWSNHNY